MLQALRYRHKTVIKPEHLGKAGFSSSHGFVLSDLTLKMKR